MFKEAYSFLLEILLDEEINQHISKYVGKKLSIINAGAQVTSPSATITLNNGECTRASNTNREIGYQISFALPFFGVNSFDKCLDFLDTVIPIFFEYRTKTIFIKSVSPLVIEHDNEIKSWVININVIVEVLI